MNITYIIANNLYMITNHYVFKLFVVPKYNVDFAVIDDFFLSEGAK